MPNRFFFIFALIIISSIAMSCITDSKELNTDSMDFLIIKQRDIGFPEEFVNSNYTQEMALKYLNKSKHLADTQSENMEKITSIPGVETLSSTFLKNGRTALIVLFNEAITSKHLQRIPKIIKGIPVVLNNGEITGGAHISSTEIISEEEINKMKVN